MAGLPRDEDKIIAPRSPVKTRPVPTCPEARGRRGTPRLRILARLWRQLLPSQPLRQNQIIGSTTVAAIRVSAYQ